MKMSRGRVDLVEKTKCRECSDAIRLALTEHRAQIFGEHSAKRLRYSETNKSVQPHCYYCSKTS